MNIEALETADSIDYWTQSNEEKRPDKEIQTSRLGKEIIKNFPHMRPLALQPLGGKAEVYVERDREGNSKAGANAEYESKDGSKYAKAEVEVDRDGKVSGRASAGINFRDEKD